MYTCLNVRAIWTVIQVVALETFPIPLEWGQMAFTGVPDGTSWIDKDREPVRTDLHSSSSQTHKYTDVPVEYIAENIAEHV